MARIGIVANPHAGTDIRRLVADALTADSRQKVNTVRRVLKGIAAIGVEQVLIMPDRLAIGARASEGVDLPFPVRILQQPVYSGPEDTQEAVRRLRESGVDVLIVLGGDGTHRVVAKVCGDVPLVGISTGTNNVWPDEVEGTLAGMAAALVARGLVPPERTVRPTNRLEIEQDGGFADLALVDVAVYDGVHRGTRAVWDVERIKELLLSSVGPARLGLSSIGSALPRPEGTNGVGLHARLGSPGTRVLAPLAPGMVCHVEVRDHRPLRTGESVRITHAPSILALDGEREFIVDGKHPVEVRLTDRGPKKVDVRTTLELASEQGCFLQ